MASLNNRATASWFLLFLRRINGFPEGVAAVGGLVFLNYEGFLGKPQRMKKVLALVASNMRGGGGVVGW